MSNLTSQSEALMALAAVLAMKLFVRYFCPGVCEIPQFPLLLTGRNNSGGNLVFVSAVDVQPQPQWSVRGGNHLLKGSEPGQGGFCFGWLSGAGSCLTSLTSVLSGRDHLGDLSLCCLGT